MVYLAGFRRGDCLTLRWCDIKDDRIVRVMAKTRFVAEVPIHPILRRHLSALPRVDEFVFGHHGSNVQVDLWFRRLSQSAGLDKRITFQALRRCAGRVWEKARPRAGSAILGHKIRGSDGHYLDEFEILTAAMPCVEIPIPMLEPNVKQPSRTEILRALQGMDRGDVLAVVHAASTLLATGANGATTGLDGRRAIELLPEPKRLTGPGASNDRRGSFNW